jgi:hypothetical protein
MVPPFFPAFSTHKDSKYRQGENGRTAVEISIQYQYVNMKINTVMALWTVTVSMILALGNIPDTVGDAVEHFARPPIGTEDCRDYNLMISISYGENLDTLGYSIVGQNHSHSIVPGGLLVTS